MPQPTSFLIFVQHTAGASGRSGVQRVVVELVRSLSALRPVRCVKWDPIEGQLRFADARDLEALFDGPPPPGVKAPARAWALHERFSDQLEPGVRHCLIMPEIPFHLPDGNEMLARMYSQCRDYGVEVASIFYDLIPIVHDAYAGDRARHMRYVAELCRHDHILAISRFSAKTLADYAAEDEVSARITAVPLPDIDDPARRLAPVEDDAGRDTILLLGTVEPRKGQMAVLRSFLDASRTSPALAKLRIVLIGSLHPAVAEELRALAARDPRIDYRGYCPDAVVEALFARTLFTVFASTDEGFGLPIAESLSHGVPVLCANFGSMAEVAEQGGCLTIDVRDEAALGAAQARLAEDGALRASLRSQIARRRFRTWEDYGRAVVDAIETAPPRRAEPSAAFVTEAGDAALGGLDPAAFESLVAADTLLLSGPGQIEEFLSEVERRGSDAAAPPRLLAAVDGTTPGRIAERRREIGFQVEVARAEHAHRVRLAKLPAATRRPRLLRIVLSTYNRADFVAANVDWLLRHVTRRRPEVEVVVVDNASTDDTEARLAHFAGAPGFRYLRNTANVGMLGNLNVCSTLPGAEYVWMIGDDDFIVPEQVAAICAALEQNFGVPLATTNFGVFLRDRLSPHDDPRDFLAEAQPLAPTPRPSGLTTVAEAAAQHDNLFTAIYPIIWRADIVAAAFNHPFSGVPFGTLIESIPSTDHILRTLGRAEIYWHAPIGVVGNLANSWSRHRPRWHSVLMPLALELARDAGVEPRLVRTWAGVHRDLFDDAMRLAAERGWILPPVSDADREVARRVLGLRLASEAGR